MKERIVLNAWEMVVQFPSLKKLNFFPAFFGMLWLFCILIYQVSYTYFSLASKNDFSFIALIQSLQDSYLIEGIIVVVCIFLGYLLTNPIAK